MAAELTNAGVPDVKNRAEVINLLGAKNQNALLLGKIVFWELHGIETQRPDLLARWEGAGLDAKYIPKGIQTRSAILRAMDEMELSGLIERVGKETREKAVWRLFEKQATIDANGEEDLDLNKEDKLTYDKKAGRLLVSRTHFQPVVDALVEKYKEKFITDDVSRILIEYVKDEGGITLKDRSGFYFLPPGKFGLVSNLEKFVNGLGSFSTMTVIDIAKTEATAGQMLKAYQAEIEADIKAKHEEIKKALAILQSGTTTKAGGENQRLKNMVESRIQEVSLLKAKITLYSEGLGAKQGKIQDLMEALNADYKAMVTV